MKDFYTNTRQCIDRYNEIQEKIVTGKNELNDGDFEYLTNFCVYMAHALIKDVGYGGRSREELSRMADIINDVVR